MTTQKFITSYNPEDFKEQVQKYLDLGYTIVPTTLIVEPGGVNSNKWYCCFMEREENRTAGQRGNL
jgi:hypothetical protein